ncbi:unnamed protein product [Kuraishia capsulata CBS 1993]|uniref:Actin patches distal protein 1 n=1 Tax=Kuraishia capsulata CBS 1993 TaxID=1382522 RepID=W6MLE9_9ASCO|nr:uncharacterized protein KUCA_T00003307001 [Kuraishia capsulata CBS 1993]CDK27329.1 unnamed protein product [Kuraishia capsulata CBS 1993]
MSFFKNILGSKDHTKEIAEILPIAECKAECLASECHTKFPNSAEVKGADATADLWMSTKPYALHCLVSTGKTDWQHDATDTPLSLENHLSQWASNNSRVAGGTIKVSCSSLPNHDHENLTGDVLILPYFVWVKGCPNGQIGDVMSELVPKLKLAEKGKISLPKELGGVEIAVDPSHAYVFLCSHRTRDKRCGITAPLMKKEMDIDLRDRDLLRDFGDDRPGGVTVAFINHVGGHKFAANLLIYLRSGENVWFARCRPTNCKAIISETILGGGKVWPEYLRLAQRFSPVKW